MKTEITAKHMPVIMIGMLLGMGTGVLLTLLFGKPATTGMSLGCAIGVVCGICFDRKQSKRTKAVVVAFFSTVLLAAFVADFV